MNLRKLLLGDGKSKNMDIPRLLFVDRDLNYFRTAAVIEALTSHFIVVPHERLTETVIDLVATAKSDPQQAFSAVVSHLPPAKVSPSPSGGLGLFSYNYAAYGPPFKLLGRIKEICDIPVVVYTGAGWENVPAFSWEESGVDSVLNKGLNPEDDAKAIRKSLNSAFVRYAQLSPAVMEPEIVEDEKGVWTETSVRLNLGIGLCVFTIMIKISSINPPTSCYIEYCTKNGSRERIQLADIFDLMEVVPECGARIKLFVSGNDAHAVKLLRKLHRLCQYRYLPLALRDELLRDVIDDKEN
jgi:hypothetical protein